MGNIIPDINKKKAGIRTLALNKVEINTRATTLGEKWKVIYDDKEGEPREGFDNYLCTKGHAINTHKSKSIGNTTRNGQCLTEGF